MRLLILLLLLMLLLLMLQLLMMLMLMLLLHRSTADGLAVQEARILLQNSSPIASLPAATPGTAATHTIATYDTRHSSLALRRR